MKRKGSHLRKQGVEHERTNVSGEKRVPTTTTSTLGVLSNWGAPVSGYDTGNHRVLLSSLLGVDGRLKHPHPSVSDTSDSLQVVSGYTGTPYRGPETWEIKP